MIICCFFIIPPLTAEAPRLRTGTPDPALSQAPAVFSSAEEPAEIFKPDTGSGSVNADEENTQKNVDAKPKAALPDGFVYISEILPEAKFDVRYATSHNFTGQVVDGYLSDNSCITAEAGEALKSASEALKKKGCGILIYDAYRPKRAVSFFMEWGEQPENNLTKDEFYPAFEKKELFKLGYLARRSPHSRGSTIDMTIYYLDTGESVDMGSPFDMMDPVSNYGTKLITETQTKNRNILRDAMKAAGFKELRTEWWHFQLVDEPYPDTYFDFVIK